MNYPFTILEYNADNLAAVLSNGFMDAEYIIGNKFHYKFFLEYFQSHGDDDGGAQTIVVEDNYISRAYLHDYAEYYSLCFYPYSRTCKRVHFFRSEFDSAILQKEISQSESADRVSITDDNYLGYIVVKGLPNISIGSAILRTYDPDIDPDRRFTVKKEYPISFFGIELCIDSLAFQEQDKVISACATSAIWSAFHKTSELFQTPIPTPSEITKSAKNLFVSSGRLFPNLGLDHTQIGNTIDSVGLEFELRNNENIITDLPYFKSFIYSYIKSGIPVLLGIDIIDQGKHLITLTGYRKNSELVRKSSKIALFSEGIKEFYAHDDQVGPYSRLLFNERKNRIKTSWWKDTDGDKLYEAEIVSVFVPIYHKIRLNFDDVLTEINPFDGFLRLWFRKKEEINWDVFIQTSNKYKCSFPKYDTDRKFVSKIRTHALPRHIWIARAHLGDKLMIEFVFDSTDIAGGHNCMMVNIFSRELEEYLRQEFMREGFRKPFEEYMGRNYYDLFLKELGFISNQPHLVLSV